MVQVRNKLVDRMIKRFVVDTSKYTLYHYQISRVRTSVTHQIRSNVVTVVGINFKGEYENN